MGKRVQLQTLLENILGSQYVYFQPPENIKIKHPCIIYKLSSVKTTFANDVPYTQQSAYTLTVVDADPDSELPRKIASLPMCSFERHYTSDNLNHDVYNIYY